MLAYAARLLTKVALRGALVLAPTLGIHGGAEIIDLRGQLPTAGQYPTRDMAKVNTVVIHHSASRGQSIRSLAQYHVAVRGWQGIGYHYAIGWDGRVYWMNDPERRTNHAQGHNSRTIGVVLVGDYDLTHPSVEMVHAAQTLTAYLSEKYGVTRIVWHRELKATACPGRYAVEALQHLHTP